MRTAKQRRQIIRVGILIILSTLGCQIVWAQMSYPLSQGNVSVGTYATVSDFKELQKPSNDQPFLQKFLSEGLANFDASPGQWKGINIFTSDKGWSDYTVAVDASKVSGSGEKQCLGNHCSESPL